MRNNVFKFGNAYYRQRSGVAIGMPPASDLAIQDYGFCEIALIKAIFRQYLRVDDRFVDNKFGVRNGPTEKPIKYKDRANNAYKLDWEFSDLMKSGVHMDLLIWIDALTRSIKWKHHTKEMNSHLHLGLTSAYPPGIYKRMITSMTEKFCKHCSEIEDCKSEIHKFYQRLLNAGHSPEFPTKTFSEVGRHIHQKCSNTHNSESAMVTKKSTKSTVKPHQRLFFHSVFYPKDISRKLIQEIYVKTYGDTFRDLLDV